MAELPGSGWTFHYAVYERPRLGREVFRPVVPVGLGPRFRRGIVGLVDSGSEHTLASWELADDMGLDLAKSTRRLQLGIGGRSSEAIFESVNFRLYRDHSDEEFVSWTTEIGFLQPSSTSLKWISSLTFVSDDREGLLFNRRAQSAPDSD